MHTVYEHSTKYILFHRLHENQWCSEEQDNTLPVC